jgi:hypothetical protein
MRIYLDQKLQSLDADASALDAALKKFEREGCSLFELSKDKSSHFSITRSNGSLFVETWSSNGLIGTLATWRQAAAAAKDYLDGRFVDYAMDDDCPICRAMREGKL